MQRMVIYFNFKAANKDKAPWDSTRNGKIIHHSGHSYKDECERMLEEIQHLKNKLIGKM